MLTADEPYPHPIRTWLAHHHTHSNFLTCITLFVALATGDHLYCEVISTTLVGQGATRRG